MAISAIPPVPGAASGVAPTRTTTAAAAPEQGAGFGDLVTKALDDLDSAHAAVDRLAVQAATGDLTAAHDYTIAATEAQLLTQLTVEVRNRAIEAFNEIMRMQV